MITDGKRKRRLAGAMILAPALFLAGCDSNTAGGDSRSVIAVVNGSPITRKDIQTAMMAKADGSELFGGNEDLSRALVEELVERRLILQRSRDMGGGGRGGQGSRSRPNGYQAVWLPRRVGENPPRGEY